MIHPKAVSKKRTNKEIIKDVDAFVTVVLIDPIAIPLAKTLARLRVSPNAITTASLLFAILSGYALVNAQYLAAAISYYLSILLDCVDGKVARATGRTSNFGREYDAAADTISTLILSISTAMVGINTHNIFMTIVPITYLGDLWTATSYHNATRQSIDNSKASGAYKLPNNRMIYARPTPFDKAFYNFVIIPLVLGVLQQSVLTILVCIISILLSALAIGARIIRAIKSAAAK